MPVTHQNPKRRYGKVTAVSDRTRGFSVTTWIAPDEFNRLDRLARHRNLTRAEIMRQAIFHHLEREAAFP